MGTTYKQDTLFISYLIPKDLLEQAIDWIKDNMEPEDVFSPEALKQWALANDMIDGI
jgi:hypothetical protein